MLRLFAVFLVLVAFAQKLDAPEAKMHFWHLAQTGSHWSLIDNDGHPRFFLSVCNIHPEQPPYRSLDIGDHWAELTAARIQNYGLDGVGAWSDPKLNPFVPHTASLDVYRNIPTIDNDQWATQVDNFVRQRVSPEDHNLVGYYLDNELDWSRLAPYATRYFEVVCGAIRKYDPNHLILGVRFNKMPPLSVVIVSARFVDVESVNYYRDEAHWNWDIFDAIRTVWHGPQIISEFSFYSDDNQSGCRNSKGFGGKCADQRDRARLYRWVVANCRLRKDIVGAEWFQWNDEPPQGRALDGEDCNFGLVDIYDRPYSGLVQAIIEQKE
jgi:hypothetical protein